MHNILNTLFKTIPKLAYILSDGNYNRMFILLIKLYVFIFLKKILKVKKDFFFPFKYNGVKIPMYLSSMIDIVALYEIYILKEYQWNLDFKVNIIIDLGAHIGDTTLYYHAIYPDAKIIAVEPSPDSFKLLKKNTKSISQINCINCAVGIDNEYISLFITESSLGNSIHPRSTTVNELQVEQVTLDNIFKKFGINKADIIKFDIEGAEEKLFDNAFTLSKSFIGEVHLDLMGVSKEDFLKKFSIYNYKTSQINKQRFILKASQLNDS